VPPSYDLQSWPGDYFKRETGEAMTSEAASNRGSAARLWQGLLGLGLCALLAVIPARAQASSLTPFAYVTNTADNTVSVVNTSTNEVVATIPVLKGAYPAQQLAAAPDGKFVYAASIFSGIVALDTATNTVAWQMTPPSVIEEVPSGTHFTESDFLPGLASGLAVSPDSQFLYVALQGTNAVAVVNTTTHKMIATISVGSCPSGMDIAPNNSRLYVVNLCSESVSVINPSTKAVTGTVLPGNEPEDVAISPNSSFAYVTGAGTAAVLDTSSNTVTGSLPSGLGGPLAFSPDGLAAYLTGGPGPGPAVSALATATKTITASIPAAEYPWDLALTPDGKSLYLVNESANDLSVVSTASNTVTDTVPVGEYPQGLAITPPIEGPSPLAPEVPASGSGSPASSSSPAPASPPSPKSTHHKKRRKCRKGFKRKKVHGKVRCVRIKKSRRRPSPSA
jgi:YVTN family beta-propeller protein